VEGKWIPLEPDASITLQIRGDVCIDGSTTSHDSIMEVSGQFEMLYPDPKDPKGRVRVNSKGKSTGKVVEQ
jgi:hypothetical protein